LKPISFVSAGVEFISEALPSNRPVFSLGPPFATFNARSDSGRIRSVFGARGGPRFFRYGGSKDRAHFLLVALQDHGTAAARWDLILQGFGFTRHRGYVVDSVGIAIWDRPALLLPQPKAGSQATRRLTARLRFRGKQQGLSEPNLAERRSAWWPAVRRIFTRNGPPIRWMMDNGQGKPVQCGKCLGALRLEATPGEVSTCRFVQFRGLDGFHLVVYSYRGRVRACRHGSAHLMGSAASWGGGGVWVE